VFSPLLMSALMINSCLIGYKHSQYLTINKAEGELKLT